MIDWILTEQTPPVCPLIHLTIHHHQSSGPLGRNSIKLKPQRHAQHMTMGIAPLPAQQPLLIVLRRNKRRNPFSRLAPQRRRRWQRQQQREQQQQQQQ
ncbi:hypothetical protein AWZ03_013092 [Drosophila navojoa]|uniref:Uncharacterized protein n=1 Tax=Drosophila navojoa TaxID=7232 RepID=A0A484AUZ9_DRONA|nr:hypothetical protein AWZ03_013092 [Drosophila navojoa]